MKKIKPTDYELRAAFAEHVCGWKYLSAGHNFGNGASVSINAWARPDGLIIDAMPDFCSDANAVLPWLEKRKEMVTIWHEEGGWGIRIQDGPLDFPGINSFSDSFPRVAVIALLRAHGVEIER